MDKLLFLGTGAADWNINEKKEGFRRFSAAMLNDDLMIDCGPHIFDFAVDFGNSDMYNGITDIVITHSHGDHFCRDSVLKLAENKKIRLGCTEYVENAVGEHENIEFIRLSAFEKTVVGGYTVMPLLANHDMIQSKDNAAFHYIIETADGKKLFYGLDGAWFLRPSWEIMRKHKFDVMVFDCTVGDREDFRLCEHNTIPMLRMMISEIKKQGLINENGKLLASHLARTLHDTPENTERILGEIGMLCAIDGMRIEF